MLKENKKLLIITTAVLLLPVLAGLILWNRLPDQLPTHWNFAGQIDDYSSKTFTVFGLFGFMLAVHLVCFFATMADPKNKNIGRKYLSLVLWIAPIISVLVGCLTYAAALGLPVNVARIMPVVLSLMFVVLGNYMPKFKQNYTMGIKLPWTLNSEENWNRTHRFAGRLWVIGGLIMALAGFMGWAWVFVAGMILLAIVPMGYSFLLYRKGI